MIPAASRTIIVLSARSPFRRSGLPHRAGSGPAPRADRADPLSLGSKHLRFPGRTLVAPRLAVAPAARFENESKK
ncbi:hypothetical protein ADL01_25290 [Streptomyces sp. NRRL WC-3618]|nr:hypothetical protein ADL01_25290 [Streptomyces sp. NRRL WC-3618]